MILLSSIIQLLEAELLAQYQDRLLPSHLKALAAMKDCRTSASPAMLAQCPDCEHRVLVPHSCGHRSCPHCQHHESQQWLERQLQRLVPGQYFLVTFTLPAAFRALAFSHQGTLFSLLIQCAWQTLSAFAHNDKSLQGTPGAIAVLHTHSRRLDFHPHVHLIVPAAAIDASRRLWRTKKSKGKRPYLFNHKALAKVFRAKLLAAITEEGLPFAGALRGKMGCRLQVRGLWAQSSGLSRALSLPGGDPGERHPAVRGRAGELSLSRGQERAYQDQERFRGQVLVADPAACLAQGVPPGAQLRLSAPQQQAVACRDSVFLWL